MGSSRLSEIWILCARSQFGNGWGAEQKIVPDRPCMSTLLDVYVYANFSRYLSLQSISRWVKIAYARPNCNFYPNFPLATACWVLNIKTCFPAELQSSPAKEYDGGRKRSPPVVAVEVATKTGFGDAHLQQSWRGHFRANSPHFIRRPLSMANLRSFDFFMVF